MEKQLDILMRRASGTDANVVTEIVQDSARRMQEKGLTQWRLYLTEAGVQRVRDRVAGAGGEEVYLAWIAPEDRPVGAVSIEWSDREYWSDRGEDGQAGYVHMLCVHRAGRGRGLGAAIVRWAETLIASRARRFARLDCWAASPFLPGYYESLGYTRQGTNGGPNGALLMEKQVRRET